MALQDIVELTVTGLGYDLVEIERSAGGLLRITIDLPWKGADAAAAPSVLESVAVTVEDCEKVTRQLQFALEVEAVEYRRLEVSSPGIDRPLRGQADFERFAGSVIDITLKAPLGTGLAAGSMALRKKFRGVLERASGPQAAESAESVEGSAPAAQPVAEWQIVWSDAPTPKPGARVSKKKLAQPQPMQVLGFALSELRDARLAPIVDFKGRQSSTPE